MEITMRRLFFALHIALTALILLNPWTSWGANIPATFYIDQTGGNDTTNTGLATDNAWKTIAKVNAFTRTNLALQSEAFQTTWGATRAAISSDATTSPAGDTTADGLIANDVNDDHFVSQAITLTVADYSFSVYAKAGAKTWVRLWNSSIDRYADFNLATGAVGTTQADTVASISSAGDGWYWCSITFTGTAAASNHRIYAMDGDNDRTFSGDNVAASIYIFGAQVELGSFASPYVPTTTAAVEASFQPSDYILFAKDNTWRETLTVPSSGSAGNVITFGAYGTGSNPKITGADVLGTSGWTASSESAVTYVSDTFDRGDTTGWGTADGGTDTDNTWDGGTTNFSIVSNKGASVVEWVYAWNTIGDSHESTDVKADFTAAANAGRDYGFMVRKSGSNFYFVYWNPSADTLSIKKDPGSSTLASESVSDPGTTFTVRVQASGTTTTTIKAKVWATGGGEPDWQVTAADSSSPHTSGVVTVHIGNVGSTVARVDNFSYSSIATAYANTYQKTLTTDPGNYVLEDNVMMTKVASVALVDSTEKSYYWDSNVIYIHATGDGSPETNGKVYETPIRSTVLSIGGNDYVTIDGLILEMGQGTSFLIQADGAQSFTLNNSTLRYSNFIGLWVSDSPKTSNMVLYGNSWSHISNGFYMHGDNIIARNNTLSHIKIGIELRDVDNAHCQNFLIEYNTLTNMGDSTVSNAGIIIDSDTYSDNDDYHQGIVRFNLFDTIQGRAMDGFIGDSAIYYNIIKNVTDGIVGSAVCLEINGKNNAVYNNVFYECGNYGLFINSDPIAGDVANIVKNNIFYSTSINHIIGVSPGVVAAVPPVINNNIYWMGSGGETKYQWGATDYTFTNWKTQSSGDANSLEADPLFVSTVTPDFSLQVGSPAINAGVDVGLTEDYRGMVVPQGSAPDIGAYEFGPGDPGFLKGSYRGTMGIHWMW
jgi:hypothetical protein